MTSLQFPRRGAWALLNGVIGIINMYPQVTRVPVEIEDPENPEKTITVFRDETDPNKAEVHLVNEVGETTGVLHGVSINELIIATLADIPESRRPSPELGAEFGYE